MGLNIEREVDAMSRMTVDQLQKKYIEVFGEPTNGRHKQWLIKRIAWRLQSNAEGGLSERALKRAAEIVNESDIRMTPPRVKKTTEGATERTRYLPTRLRTLDEVVPGVTLHRVYKGQEILVKVVDDGFEYLGERYKSLSAIAKVVTGQHMNGPAFFNLRKTRGTK